MAIPVGGVHPIVIYEGAGFREEFKVFEDNETTEIPFVTGATAKAQVRAGENQSGRLLAEFDVEIDNNSLIISLSAEDSIFDISKNSTSRYQAYYDIFVTEPGQDPIMFMEGIATINRAVTVGT